MRAPRGGPSREGSQQQSARVACRNNWSRIVAGRLRRKAFEPYLLLLGRVPPSASAGGTGCAPYSAAVGPNRRPGGRGLEPKPTAERCRKSTRAFLQGWIQMQSDQPTRLRGGDPTGTPQAGTVRDTHASRESRRLRLGEALQDFSPAARRRLRLGDVAVRVRLALDVSSQCLIGKCASRAAGMMLASRGI